MRLKLSSDISENKRAEQALKESEEQYRLLFERAPDAILLLEDTRITRCNLRATDGIRVHNKRRDP